MRSQSRWMRTSALPLPPNRDAEVRRDNEFARAACELALQYREAKTIHLVIDNLNIHRQSP